MTLLGTGITKSCTSSTGPGRASRSSSRLWHSCSQNGSMFTSRCTAMAELMILRTCP